MKRPKEGLTQPQRFEALARELECDTDEGAFKAKLRKVATAPKAPKGQLDKQG